MRGLPVIYDAHEDLPRQILTKQWIPARFRRLVSQVVERYENHLASRLLAVVAATPHIARRFGAVCRRVATVSNFPFVDELAPTSCLPPRERVICYVGGLMRSRGLRGMVQATAMVTGLKLILCGTFEDSGFEAGLRAEPGWQQVEYRGQVGRKDVREVMARSRAGLVTLLPFPSYMDALPIKLFEYMSAGLPVIASDFPSWRSLIAGTGTGLVVDPEQVEAIAEAIRCLLDDPDRVERFGQAGLKAGRERHNWLGVSGTTGRSRRRNS